MRAPLPRTAKQVTYKAAERQFSTGQSTRTFKEKWVAWDNRYRLQRHFFMITGAVTGVITGKITADKQLAQDKEEFKKIQEELKRKS